MARVATREKPAIDMIGGNLFWKLVRFALPIMAATAMQLLYTTVDLTTVHYGESSDAMGAIASNGALINLIIVVFTGMSLGVNVIVSEARGAGDVQKGSKALHTSLLFALISGFFVGLLGFLFSDDLLRLMDTTPKYLDMATLYLRIYFVGLPFLMIFNYAAQLLRAQGDSRTPFLILAAAGIVNVGVDCLFVLTPLKMGVAGVGWATVISEGVSCVLAILALKYGKRNFVRLEFKKLGIDRAALLDIVRVGLPAGLQGFFFSLPNVFIQSSLYTIDPGNTPLINGATASGNIEGYFYVVVEGLRGAVMTFIAANVGAKKKQNIPKVFFYGVAWAAIFCAVIALITAFAYRPLLSLFVDDEVAIEAGRQRLSLMGYFYFLNTMMGMTAGVLGGLRKPSIPMVTTLVFCTGLRILLILTVFRLEQFHTLLWLYSLFPITWTLATITNCVAIAIVMPRTMKKIERSLVELPQDAEPIPLETGE